MNKTNIGRLLRSKWFILLVFTAILIFFGRIVDNKSLNQSAIVIGMGIDRDAETGVFNISVQAVVDKGSAGQAKQMYTVYSAEGNTISEGLDKINQKMGLIVSLSHCNVVVVSPEALKTEQIQLFAPLTGAFSLPEQSIIVTGALSPEEILSGKIGTTVVSPYFLQETLMQNNASDGLANITIKDFMAETLSRSGSVNIPYIEARKMASQPIDPESEQKDVYEFILNKNLVLNAAKSEVIDEDMASITAIFTQSNIQSKLSVSMPTGENVEFRVLKKKDDVKAEGMKVSAEIKLSVSFVEAQNVKTEAKITANDPIVLAAAKQLETELKKQLDECFKLSQSLDIDFLRLENEVYKKIGRKLKKNCLGDISLESKFEITIKENS